MFSSPAFRSEFPMFHSFFDDNDALKKIIDKRIEKNDINGARQAANRIFVGFDRDAALKKIVIVCLGKGDLDGAKRAANDMFLGKTDALNMILDREIEANDFVGAIGTCGSLQSQIAVQKVADKMKMANLDTAALKEIEETALNKTWLFSSLQIIILKVLMSLYRALGNQSEVDRLEKKVAELSSFEFFFPLEALKKPLALLVGAEAGLLTSGFTQSVPVIGAVGTAAALAVLYPPLRRAENLLGVGAGAAAIAAGLTAPQSAAIGLGTAIVTRIPLAKSAAIGVINVGGSIAEGIGNSVLWTGKTMVGAVDKTLNYVVFPLVEGTVNLTAKATVGVANGILNASSFGVDCLGSVLNGVDSVLDTITFQK